ncbi:hypothetical protein GCM10019016_017360 [Streptomyces prasinosporus]|uniref:Uncharacterized protein n=1 Tax=Streptomyces prasinosporus TaxID=68256 RepID=A0ABP6TJU4_9ACTN
MPRWAPGLRAVRRTAEAAAAVGTGDGGAAGTPGAARPAEDADEAALAHDGVLLAAGTTP